MRNFVLQESLFFCKQLVIPPQNTKTKVGYLKILEQFVALNGIKNIIVYGHMSCRVLIELVEQSVMKLERLSLVPPLWQKMAQSTIDLLKAHYGEFSKEDLVFIAIQENILAQIEHLLTYPFIKERSYVGN